MDKLTSELDQPMLIVTTAAEGELSGCLVGFHSQCSITPHRWALWISKTNHTYGVAQRARTLVLHFPSVDDLDLAHLFGEQTGDEVDKFARCEWTSGRDGVPLLDRLPNRIVGGVRDTFDDDGDHQLFVVEVDDMQHGSQPLEPLGFQAVRGFDPGHAP